MQKLLTFALVSLVAIIALVAVSCNSKHKAPEITFMDNTRAAHIEAGTTYELKVTINAEGKLKEVRYYRQAKGGQAEPFGKPITTFSQSTKYESIVRLQDIESSFMMLVEATDKKGQTTRACFAVIVGNDTSYAEFEATGNCESANKQPNSNVTQGSSYKQVTMGFNMINTVASSFSVKTGQPLLLADAKQHSADIDFMFFMGVQNGITIAAPSDGINNLVFNNEGYGVQTWSQRNHTSLVKVNGSFNNLSDNDIKQALASGSQTMINHLQVGDIMAFKTASGQIGLVQITDAGPTSASTFHINVRTIN